MQYLLVYLRYLNAHVYSTSELDDELDDKDKASYSFFPALIDMLGMFLITKLDEND